MKPNNVNVEGMMAFVEQAKQDPGVLKKQKRVEGTWSLDEGQPQFSATLDYPAGQRTLQADLAPFMGGSGIAPDPIQVLPLRPGRLLCGHVRRARRGGRSRASESQGHRGEQRRFNRAHGTR